MSTPAGHSDEQALQDRQKSSASRTSGARQPPVTRLPLTISCRTLARPRVESRSSLVAWYDGHITRVVPAVLATHLPTPVQRCTAAAKSPSCGYARPSRSRPTAARARAGAGDPVLAAPVPAAPVLAAPVLAAPVAAAAARGEPAVTSSAAR